VMRRIIDKVETNLDYERVFHQRGNLFQSRDLTTIISYNAVSTAFQCRASAILVLTKSGYSARMISKLRPNLPIYAFTPDPKVFQQLSLSWGVFPHIIVESDDFETMMSNAIEHCVSQDYLHQGELVVMVAGLPMGTSGRTNMIRVEPVGKCRIPVKVVHPGDVTAPALHICGDSDLTGKDLSGKILLLKTFKVEYTATLRYAAGIVAENDDWEEDLRVLGIACNIPVFVNARAALDLVVEGTMVQMDSAQGLLLEV
jgi:pyruvate kinase